MVSNRSILLSIILFLIIPSNINYANAMNNNEFFSECSSNKIFFFNGNIKAYKISSALSNKYQAQHNILQLNLLADNILQDEKYNEQALEMLEKPALTEPGFDYTTPFTARGMWQLYRAIDWTHMHHEQTYGIMSEHSIPWKLKKKWTDRAVRYYLAKHGIPRSPAPLDITLRRAAVIMKPYFTYFRNYYPRSNEFFYAAHWWHPAIYEAMMLGGNGSGQEKMVRETDATMFTQVIKECPGRMLLSREIMPRYSKLSPESANIFDNLHMLNGIAYDILSYKDWTIDEKKKELYRVITAMSYQPGDEKYARKFSLPYPDVDPRVYQNWMKGTEGDISRIISEMLEEIMPLIIHEDMGRDMKEKLMEQVRMKMTPGMQNGEISGSLADAIMKTVPGTRIIYNSAAPGETPEKMVEIMLKGWQEKYGNMPDIEPICMDNEPVVNP